MVRNRSRSTSRDKERSRKERDRDKRDKDRGDKHRSSSHRHSAKSSSKRSRSKSRSRSRSRSQSPRESRHHRDRRSDRSKRSRSRSKSPTLGFGTTLGGISKKKNDTPIILDPQVIEGKTDDEIQMLKVMGFAGFDTTKGKHVEGTNHSAINIQQKRKYRQYMNRRGGFNRPLDPVA